MYGDSDLAMENTNISSYKRGRKAKRKQTRYASMLLRDTGIKCVDVPTTNLFIGNAGLVSGMKRESLLEMFSSYGLVEEIVMLPGKSYSFIVYQEPSAAALAYNAVHGKQLKEFNMRCLYLAYTEKLPDTQKLNISNTLPSGIEVLEDFVTWDEENVILNCIDWSENETDSAQSLKHRKVTHYGFKFRYDINNVDKDDPLSREIPRECDFIISRLKERGYKKDISFPDQLTVNQYAPGQGIPPHIDTHSAFEEHILSLSLGSTVVMEFEHVDGRSTSVLLPQRSLLIMSGEARYAWKHGITPRKTDIIHSKDGSLTVMKRGTRTSLTFRKILKGDCKCSFHNFCDSFQKTNNLQQQGNEELASQLEELHVHQVYEKIANHFSETRHKPWPNVVAFLTSLPRGAILVDVGCGNGKYLAHNSDVFKVGCDQSISLTRVCQEKGFEVFNCSCLRIPLRSDIADGCISIAVIHHLSTQERRLKALEEMARILKPGGRALVYVWAKNQECGRVKSNYLKFTSKKKNKFKSSETSMIVSGASDTEPELVGVGDHHRSPDFDPCDCKGHSKSESSCYNLVADRDFNKLSQDSCTSELSVNNTENGSSKILNLSEISKTTETCQLPELPVHVNRTQFKHSDVFVPWKLKQSQSSQAQTVPVLYRYYHVFEEGELEKMCACVEGIRVIRNYYDQGNWCIIFEKI
ncbi:alkylated DNA repair protein alkB homolog 8 [Schistocerca piceifrons]|uniref:alkylated DNA repair protein alkB homolog 8 n=1 Tax=Schistocerca piceifrons TaxID=274613 RepID=UPI001F5EE6FC|nr:alkylated DNA repair protein alkB homolog 8 [Schistocerca piceifrons]